jgi:hypothetical protein
MSGGRIGLALAALLMIASHRGLQPQPPTPPGERTMVVYLAGGGELLLTAAEGTEGFRTAPIVPPSVHLDVRPARGEISTEPLIPPEIVIEVEAAPR